MDQKFFLKSMTIWGCLIAAAPPLLTLIGITPSPDDIHAVDESVRSVAQQAWDLFNQVNVYLGAAVAWYGRKRASSTLTWLPKLPAWLGGGS